MSNISGDWSGKIQGTNNADIFVEFEQSESQLSGTARINDPTYGTSVYVLSGNINEGIIQLEGDPTPESIQPPQSQSINVAGREVVVQTNGVSLEHITVNGKIVESNRIEGKWVSSIDTGGTLWISQSNSTTESSSKFDGNLSDNIAFIMMSISNTDPSLEDSLNAIKRGAAKQGIDAKRVDEIEHSKKITDVILEKLRSARFLICDISTERPNVYYELGFAHGINKDVILVAKEGTPLHFDIKDYNVILYRSYSELENRVSSRIADAIAEQ